MCLTLSRHTPTAIRAGRERDQRSINAALAGYDTARRLFGTRAVARAHKLGAHIEAQVTKPRHFRTAEELHQKPTEAAMREFGPRLADIPELAELTAG